MEFVSSFDVLQRIVFIINVVQTCIYRATDNCAMFLNGFNDNLVSFE